MPLSLRSDIRVEERVKKMAEEVAESSHKLLTQNSRRKLRHAQFLGSYSFRKQWRMRIPLIHRSGGSDLRQVS